MKTLIHNESPSSEARYITFCRIENIPKIQGQGARPISHVKEWPVLAQNFAGMDSNQADPLNVQEFKNQLNQQQDAQKMSNSAIHPT
jgi:hypothetical protein